MFYTRIRMKLKKSENFENALPLDYSIEDAIEKALLQTTLLIQTTARSSWYAPYKTWTLRKSITSDLSQLKKWTTVVWSDVKYANIQEVWWDIKAKNKPYLHFKINWKWVKVKKVTIKWKRYLRRAFEDNESKILNIINKAIKKELW